MLGLNRPKSKKAHRSATILKPKPSKADSYLEYGLILLGSFIIALVCGALTFTPDAVSGSESGIINVNLASGLALTLSSDEVNIVVTPTASGVLETEDVIATVSTNNPTGYKLTMHAITNDTALRHTNTVNSLPSTTNTTASTLANDTWGYGNGPTATTFLAIPAPSAAVSLKTTAGPTASDDVAVTIGVKISTASASGTYHNTLVFTATTNYVPTPTIINVSPTTTSIGKTVIITGTNFYAGGSSSAITKVTVGSTNCTSFSVTSNTTLTCVVPTLSDGTYPLTVVTSMGMSNTDINLIITTPLTPPPGSIPDSINPTTNPAALDVYPTSGWDGEVVVITSNALFTNVQSVIIGGTPCIQYDVVSTSAISCKLPTKAHGSINDIAVMNGPTAPGTNITPTSTYNHMRITYFDPTASTVTIAGTTYAYYPNGFTNTNCSALTATNSATMNLPNSIVYMRDTRNNQVYKIKRMIDNKCWMIDNLKYIDTTVQNYDGAGGTAGSVGMVFRSGRGPNIPSSGTGTSNTVDGSGTQSATNGNKAFYNNPMSEPYCYGTTNMPAQTTTRCGYLYNWFAATKGSGDFSISTNGNQATSSICPANFRLPSAVSGSSLPTSNGTNSVVADIPVLNASMNAGALATGATADYITNWLPAGAWAGVFSGDYITNMNTQSTYAYYQSSTNATAANARFLGFSSTVFSAGTNNFGKHYGFAVRCVMP